MLNTATKLDFSSSQLRYNQLFLALMTLLFLAAPFYYQINPGGEGLLLPFNSAVWLVVSFIIGLGLLQMLHSNTLRLPSISLAMLFFLATTTLLGMIKSVVLPEAWLFRSLALWAGILFYLSLAQFPLSIRQKDLLLYLLVFSAAGQAIIGLIQIFNISTISNWIPFSPGIPRGIFQQQNLNATFNVTGLLVGIYVITRPSFLSRHSLLQAMLWISIGLCTTTVITSGSRIGLITAIIGTVLMLSCRYRYWLNHKSQALILAFVLSAFTATAYQLPSQTGVDRGLAKLSTTADSSEDVRLMIYGSSWELIKESPVLGYGIGQFESVWHEKKIDYLARHPNASILEPRLSHPHNELLYWAIEGGLAAVLGILVMAAVFLWRAGQLGWQRGGSYIAMVLPIAAHSQVELPFYISQLHWIVFIFLIFLVGQHRIQQKPVNLSAMARTTLLATAIFIPVATSVFTAKNLTSLQLTMAFITGKDQSFEKLELAGKNLYFSRWVTAIQMQIIFQTAFKTDDIDLLQRYIPMAQSYLTTTPEANVMANLSLAFHKTGDYDASHRVLFKTYKMYATNPHFQRAQRAIMALDKEAGIFDKYWKAQPNDE